MRHIPARSRDSWATYVTAARESVGILSKAELARRLGIARETVSRWESGHQRPEDAELVAEFAAVVDVPLDEALAAAGLRPDVEPPTAPAREPDPELDLIRSANIHPERKKALIRYVLMRRARDEQARLEDLEQMIREP